MIKVVAKKKMKSDVIDETISIYEELITETRKEKGCISYELFQDVNDPTIITMIEEWEDQEALKAHSVSEHFTRIVPKITDMSESSELNVYQKIR